MRMVREEEDFLEQKTRILAGVGTTARVFEDLQETFAHVLSLRPDIYPLVLESLNVRAFNTRQGVLPALTIWYTYDETLVRLLWVEERGASDTEVAPVEVSLESSATLDG